ncbi:heparinase II/III family protein [Vreelandella venusta]|uniref:heparinase II/III family protein n=1 Tax=Vreelandella venusta TaxID=44935 RepID=UPI003C2F2878
MAERYSEELIDFMTTNELLDCVKLGANDYIQTTINTKNKADYQKLKKLFDAQQFEAKSFEDSDLDILIFDWQSLERDRNWWWQLQALPFLNWYANSFSLQSEEERTRYFSLCLDAIHNWVNQAKQNTASPLVWHDHAAAFRVRNLTNWLVFCHSMSLPLSDDSSSEALASLITEHLDWIQEDKHYSKHTNHGFDQAMIALAIGLMFDHEDFDAYQQRNRERLKDEVTFAFTDEGVHKENSPGYQKMMLGRLKQLRTLATLGEKEISQMGECYIEKAEAFLRAITLPNGYLPMIGDTRGGDKGLPYNQSEKVDVLDYSASGYVIARGRDGKDKDFFILIKNTHESNYHRHDDDMMIYLFYDGEVVLGDGGLYKHQESDHRRKYLRSHFSHSVPYIDKPAVRSNRNVVARPTVIRKGTYEFLMKSMMFGEQLSRKVSFLISPSLSVEIHDSIIDASDSEVWSNLFFEKRLDVSIDNGSALFDFVSFKLEVEFPNGSAVALNQGFTQAARGAYVSRDYGCLEEAMSLSIAGSPLIFKL